MSRGEDTSKDERRRPKRGLGTSLASMLNNANQFGPVPTGEQLNHFSEGSLFGLRERQERLDEVQNYEENSYLTLMEDRARSLGEARLSNSEDMEN